MTTQLSGPPASDENGDKPAEQAAHPAAAADDPALREVRDELRADTAGRVIDALTKLPIDASFEELAAGIPEVKAMIGMDQRSDFHSLTLDEHTKELVRQLAANPLIAGHPKRDLILLAGKLHDVGKTSPAGQQIHPKDPEKRQYVGHEKESARMIAEILPQYFVDIPEEDRELVIRLAGLHASALSLVGNFTANNQPKGKDLGSYDRFIAEVEQIPGGLELEEKMRIIFALNRADKLAGCNDASDKSDPKVQDIIAKSIKQTQGLDELEKALPVLILAIMNKRKGDQEAGIVCENGVYKLKEKTSKAAAGGLEDAKVRVVMAEYDKLGLPADQRTLFEKTLKEDGIPGLGKAGFGRAIGPVKKIIG